MSKIENLDQSYSLKKIDKETINIKVHNNDILISVVFLDPAIKLLIPRGTASSLENFGRGVTLLSTEPSRASYEFIFIYLVLFDISLFDFP